MIKKLFTLYNDYRDMFEALSDEDAGKLIKAVFAHEAGEDFELDGPLKGIYILICNQLDRDREKYEKTCEKNKAIAKKRWENKKTYESIQEHTNAYESIPEHTSIYESVPGHTDTDTDTDTDIDTETDIGCNNNKTIKNKKFNIGGSGFIKPSVEEVRAYCRERGNNVDPEAFVNFYNSKGWMIGKSPMKDWKAAVVNWEKNSRKRNWASPQEKGLDEESLKKYSFWGNVVNER